MLTDAQKTDVRRHCGFQMFGDQATQAFGHRFFTHYGTLEFRINHASSAEEAEIIKKADELNALEQAVLTTSDGLDTNKAAVWERNPREMAERIMLYTRWRITLCQFLGIAPGPGIVTGSEIMI